MRSWTCAALLVTLALVGSIREARADGGRAVVEAAACAESAEMSSARFESLLSGPGAKHHRVFVHVELRGGGYRVVLRMLDGGGRESETVITAASCEEASEAAAVVLALALGMEPALPAPVAPPAPAPLPADSATAPPSAAVPPRARDTAAVVNQTRDASRVALATGADSGTLPVPTLYVSGAVARSLSAFELRGVVRYGLPTIDDSAEDAARHSQRSDFGALELRGCYGIGARFRLSGCTGTELGAVRRSRRWQSDGLSGKEDAIAARFSGVFAAAVAHRAGPIQPELELSGAAVAFGREPQASWLVLRMSVGAALVF